jgi:hypothetical protein
MAITDTSLEWDAAKQAFKIDPRRFGLGGRTAYIKVEDLPAGVEVVWDSAGDYKSAKVSRSFIEEKLPELQKTDKGDTKGTVEEYEKARQDITNKLPDGSPLPNQKVQFNISRSDIIKGKDIKVMEGGAAGVVYIDPETKDADAAGVQVVIKPTGFSGFGYGGGQGGEYKGFEIVSAETEVANVINQARRTTGGIKELKTRLFQSGFYSQAQVRNPAKSLRMGDNEDLDMQAALGLALQAQAIANYGLVQQNKGVLDFDGWIEEATAAFAGSEDVKTVNLPGKLTAEQAAISSYQRFLGRTPNQNEILAFMSAANEYARANPNVSSMDYLSGTATQINQPGFNEQELNSFAEDYATAQPGAAEYGLGQGGYETFNGAVNILLNELSAQGARRVKPGDK